ncbi:TIGR03016 family PEP-CTERM system-associated outer membrane protein [Noviherbaspirillum soli]|uniref:TIGR03016 family PEP-CTERM system-associated outer membrane protein n=1 Tax=Noviherbaspirillum soli TaxID=1064518 RepID=UPI00188D3981|nr:TIGR03016 family PEP-CTERM system-associated outer membrane protein [Noviherbaspirillum soli]
MARTTCKKFVRRPAALAALAVLGMQAAPALAAEWRFNPTLTLRETYSDNIRLAPTGNEQSSFVTEVMPGISVNGLGRRSQFQATYQARGVTYSNDVGSSNLQNYLNARGTAQLVDDLLFIDGTANITNLSTSPYGPQALDSSYAINNRSEVRTYSISPYVRQRYGSVAQAEARYTHQGLSSDTAGFSNYNSDLLNLFVNSGEAFRLVSWDVTASRRHSSYNSLNSVDNDYLNGVLRYKLTDQFSLTGSAGYDRYTYQSIGDGPRGASWSVGFDWKPSSRTSLAATAGRRFYGNAYSLNGIHRSRYTTWNVSYNEDITTTQQQLVDSGSISTTAFLDQVFSATIADPTARAQAVDAFIRATNLPATLANPNAGLSNRFFLQKRLQGSVALNTGKSTVLVSVYNTLRRPQTGVSDNVGLFTASNQLFIDESRQRGVSGLWNLRLTPLTSMNLNARYYRTTSLLSNRTDDNTLVTLGLSHQLSPKTTGTVELRRYQGSYSQTGTDFRENAISAYLTMRL